MKATTIVSIVFLSSFGILSPMANAQDWMTDYEGAFIKARNEGKHVLINFTGSDWCGWCKRLDREVFSRPEFIKYADENLILLKLDFPRYTPQPREVRIKNQEYKRRFSVRGFPTILIAVANQRVVLRTGYQPGGAPNYVNHIDRVIN